MRGCCMGMEILEFPPMKSQDASWRLEHGDKQINLSGSLEVGDMTDITGVAYWYAVESLLVRVVGNVGVKRNCTTRQLVDL